MKSTRAHATRRTTPRPLATKRPKASSPNAEEIVRLVRDLSSGLGSEDGVVLGRGIVELVAHAYREERLSLPSWVRQLASHYAPTPADLPGRTPADGGLG